MAINRVAQRPRNVAARAGLPGPVLDWVLVRCPAHALHAVPGERETDGESSSCRDNQRHEIQDRVVPVGAARTEHEQHDCGDAGGAATWESSTTSDE